MEAWAKLQILEDALVRLGVSVRHEALPEGTRISGGLCSLRGEPVVFVTPDAPDMERVAVMVEALRKLDTRDMWLPPLLRELIDGPRRRLS